MSGAIRRPAFASGLSSAQAELFDGISPVKQRVALSVTGEGGHAVLELRSGVTQAVTRWPVAGMRLLPDQSQQDTLILAPDDTDPARLVLREMDAMRLIFDAAPRLKTLAGPRGGLLRLAGMALGAVVAVAGILLVLIPQMAVRGAAMMPPEAEMALGQAAFEQVYLAGGTFECTSPEGRAALDAMQARLTRGLDLPYPVTTRVVSDSTMNATALPGGYVTLYRGLIEAAETPEEVAAVLAHEIGHVAHRDGTTALLRNMGSFGIIGLVYGDFLGGSAMAGLTQAVMNASYSRSVEARADAFAHDLLTRNGLSPAALGRFFQRIRDAGLDVEVGVFRHLSTHPDLLDRIESASAADTGAAVTTPILSDAEWTALRTICATRPDASATKG